MAIINGFIQPLSSLVYGKLTDDLMIPTGDTNLDERNGTSNNTMNQNLTNTNFLPSEIPTEVYEAALSSMSYRNICPFVE